MKWRARVERLRKLIFRQRPQRDEIRDRLVQFQAHDEMVRVFLTGRRNLRAAVCFAGYPRVGITEVTLVGTDNYPRAVVPLHRIAAIQRVYSTRR